VRVSAGGQIAQAAAIRNSGENECVIRDGSCRPTYAAERVLCNAVLRSCELVRVELVARMLAANITGRSGRYIGRSAGRRPVFDLRLLRGMMANRGVEALSACDAG